MTVSTIGVADADTPDKYLHTNQRTISSTAREDQYVLPGMGAYPTYVAAAQITSIATADAHIIQVMGDGSNYSRIVAIRVEPVSATSAGYMSFSVVRLSSAGTGGSSVTPAPFDTADTYAGGAMTLPSSKGTEGATLYRGSLRLQTAATSTSAEDKWLWVPSPLSKPLIFGSATSSGVCVKNLSAQAGGIVNVYIEFITTTFL